MIIRYYKHRFITKDFENIVLIDVFGAEHWYKLLEGSAWGPAWGAAWGAARAASGASEGAA